MVAYRNFTAKFCWLLALTFAAFEFYTVGFGLLAPMAQRATMVAFSAVLVFLLYPTAQWTTQEELSSPKRLLAGAWDFALLGIALWSCIYLILFEADLADRSGAETELDLLTAFIGPIVILDMVRRVAGLPLFYVCLSVVAYAYWGDIVMVTLFAAGALEAVRRWVAPKAALALLIAMAASLLIPDVRTWLDPGTFFYKGTNHDRLASFLWLTADGTFGTITAIMTEFIFVFILLSGVLEATGAGQILMNLAFALTGKYRGGPAQAAVVASSMFGMVSGSTMANVVSTGTFTIPLMIRTGFSRVIAGAVEAVASCGGQIMPPIMGASVFIMSDIIGVPYIKLMLYGLVPALMYFFCLSSSIYFEASRTNLGAMDPAEIPVAYDQIKQGGYLLIPVFLLLSSIIAGETPGRAGFKAVLSLLVMVDLVRSLKWMRHTWGPASVGAMGAAIAVALFLAYGPVKLPDGDTGNYIRYALFGLGLACAIVPGLRGFPIVLPLALATAIWKFPPELLWMGQVPFVGLALPIILMALVVYLIALPIFTDTVIVSAQDSAREFGKSVLQGFEKGAKNSLSLVAATSSIGMVVGLLVLAALGVRISIFVTEVATVSLFLALVMVMMASLVMGMGLPTIAAYLLLVLVVAPALQDLGTSLVAAHMFIFYFGVISSITPPVALAAYGASGISGADPMRTGFASCRLAITAFIAPFLFVYHPELLLLEGTGIDIAYRIAVSFAGIYFISMAAMGYGFKELDMRSRGFLTIVALLLFMAPMWMNAVGLALGIVHILWQRKTIK
ncbi:MAG: TRAP transporter large permease subunit [Rhodospirillaceae bacterium]|nr:TRAP transporter large permease subunit [Rhodospirillales bacterium]MBT3907873.1 TRAP transporter large permease subunit [Rhodospirillaceae bacterium]MBT4703293.1 TRAP transporter large permease subunit [Rhodospirillaceae bacterium]MBT5035692.1 TRAP transporter large permease subunit [Rhodospirillaceae bacterium]MBT6218695.1 TRAP transporter large permease subunit [Rhodospirillaceae bacterium]